MSAVFQRHTQWLQYWCMWQWHQIMCTKKSHFPIFLTYQNQVYWGEEQFSCNTLLNCVLSSDIPHRYVEDPFRRQLEPTTDSDVLHPTVRLSRQGQVALSRRPIPHLLHISLTWDSKHIHSSKNSIDFTLKNKYTSISVYLCSRS